MKDVRTILCAFALSTLACEGAPMPAPEGYALRDEVDVMRDSLGVVHIYARSDEDLFYASGYMQAVDRLFQMDLTRRRALGRRAEVLGARFVSDDTIVRVVDLPRWAREGAELMRRELPEDYRLMVAWIAGVNARIQEIRSGTVPRPYGFGARELDYAPELWEIADGFAVGKLILWGNANQIEFDLLATIIRDFLPDTFARVPLMAPMRDSFVLPPDERPAGGMASEPIVSAPRADIVELPSNAAELLRERLFHLVPSPTAAFASNNWALDGRHTASGRPMVAGDPHQPLESPSLFWMQHMNSADAGGSFDVTGFSFVGSPTVQLGHNRHVSWTATTSYPDISDLWAVRATRSNVRLGAQEVAIVQREERIGVAGAEPVVITVEEVPGYGVLLPEDFLPIPIGGAGRRLLYRWVGMQPTREGHAFLRLDRAETLDDVDAAVDAMELGCFNFVAASAGGITYRSSPLVPDRGAGATERMHWTVLDGDDASTFWTGRYLGRDQLPRSRSNERGWIASANNDPFGFTADGTTSADPWYFGVFFDPGTRSARIEQRLRELTERGAITAADMQELQMDSHSVLADALVPIIEEAWAAVQTDETLAAYRDRPELARLVELLTLEWDREMRRDAAGAVPFDMFCFFVARVVLQDDLGLVFDSILESEPMYLFKWAVLALRRDFARADELLQAGRERSVLLALESTAALLEERFGGVEPERYRWADHHGSRFRTAYGERLDGGWIPTDGGVGTVNVSSASFFRGGRPVERLESGGGPLYRMVTELGEDGVPRARVTVARGNSGDPDSPFFSNTTSDWVEGIYRPLHFTRAEADADATERWTLSP